MFLRRAVSLVLLLTALLLGLALGQLDVPLGLLLALDDEGPGALVLSSVRGPRVFAALGAGAALGISGALFQTLFRNPLASPDILGFTASAGLAVIIATAFGIALPLPLAAALGGLLAALLVVALAYKRSQPTAPLTIILVGLGIGFFAQGGATFLMTLLPTQQAFEAQRWLMGSLAARDWGHVTFILASASVLALLAFLHARALGVLQLGDPIAQGLGLNPRIIRWSVMAIGVLLATAAVAVAGPVPFVALMAGPLGAALSGARSVTGKLLAAAAAGATVLILADLAARALVPGLQLPAGVMTGLMGAPYLLWRLSLEMRKGGL